MKLWEELRQTGGSFGEYARRSIITHALGGKTQTSEQAYREYCQNGLADCELFYSRHADQVGDRFSRSQFTDYIKQYMSDKVAPSVFETRGQQLIRTLVSFIKMNEESARRLDAERREAERQRQDEIRDRQEAERSQREHEEMIRQFELDSQQPVEPIEEDVDTIEKRMKLKAMQIVSDQLDDIEASLGLLATSRLPNEAKEEEEAKLRAKRSGLQERFFKLQDELDG